MERRLENHIKNSKERQCNKKSTQNICQIKEYLLPLQKEFKKGKTSHKKRETAQHRRDKDCPMQELQTPETSAIGT